MKVLIIGGMGIIGGAITEAACRKGYDVVVLSRRKLFGGYKQMPVRGVSGDWKNDDFVQNVLKENFDVIIDTLIFNPHDLTRDIRLVNGHCKQFIFISTDSVYPHPGQDVYESIEIDETLLKWSYGINKWKAELSLAEEGNNCSFFWTVIRPTITFGNTRIPVGFASRKNEWTLVSRIKSGKPILCFDNDKRHAICHTSTFGSAAVDLFLNSNAAGECYHISDDNSITYIEVFKCISDILGVKPVLIYTDAKILKRLNYAKYEEMIYDKNPEFTVKNDKIKRMSPTTSYNISLYDAIKTALVYMEDRYSSNQPDVDYEYMSDSILLSYKKLNLSEADESIVEEYISSLSDSYINKLKIYSKKMQVKSIVRPFYLKARNLLR